jgi:hypothetical protein
MRLGSCREVDDSGGPFSLQYHFLTPWILILILLPNRKRNMGEVEEKNIQGNGWTYKDIFVFFKDHITNLK